MLVGCSAVILAACGGRNPSAPVPSEDVAGEDLEGEDFPADASATHFHPMHHAALGPIYGSGCPSFGHCGCGNAATLAQESACQLEHLAAYDIPITAYLFDGDAWSLRNSAETSSCSGPDCCSWKLGDEALARLARGGVRGILHFWGGCHDAEQYARAYSKLGRNLLGFYLDDGSSDEELQKVSEYMQSAIPGDWECVAKAYQNREPSTSDAALSKWANAAYVGDLSFEFGGLKDAVERVIAKSRYVPAPFAEFTGYGYLDDGRPEEEIYHRRLHFGALQPVMAHTPFANADPWRPEYSPSLLQAYRYWTWLHRELVPYFYSYAYRMYETPSRRVLRRGPMTYSLRVGSELYVPLVTEPTRSMDVVLPSGQWIDYWDESQRVSGALRGYPVPLGREPVFIRQGAIVPMDVQRPYTGHGGYESKGSLTVLVYPSGTSSFRYRESAQTPWVTFTSVLLPAGEEPNDQLTLTADPFPNTPVLYRINRWNSEPLSVSADGATLTVNAGGSLSRASSEAAVNGSERSAWFYDAQAARLIVKVAPGSSRDSLRRTATRH